MAQKDDLLIVVSGSGNSPNIINALKYAYEIGMPSIALLGFDGGKAAGLCSYLVHIPSFDMQICEDIHLSFGHIIMKLICDEKVHCNE